MQLIDLPANPLPAGAIVHDVRCAGTHLRIAVWDERRAIVAPCRGTVVILPGRSEFIEKYAEVVGDLLARRFVVVVIDWRGQGGSSRLLADRRRGHIRHFSDYRDDLDAVLTQLVMPLCPKPFFGLAHSMGGAIALDHARSGTSPFARLVLSAPMLDLFGLRTPKAARALARSVVAVGGGRRYIPGGSGRSWMAQPFEGNALTSDRRRYAAFRTLARAAPDLLIGAPTFAWLHAAFQAMDGLARPGVLDRVTTPVLAIACGADRVVDTAATERIVRGLKIASCIVIPHAYHEILMEQDALRTQFWAAFDAFIPGT